MTIEIISVTTFNSANVSVTVPSGLSNSALIVLLGTHQGTISTVAWNGNSLTKIGEGASAFNECGDVWMMLSPTAGTGNNVVTMSGGSWYGGLVLVVQNVKQTLTLTNTTGTGSTSPATLTLAPESENVLVVAGMGSEATPTLSTPASAQFYAQIGQSFENAGEMFYITKTGVPQTTAMTLSSGQRWGMAVATIRGVSIPSKNSGYRNIEVGSGMSRSEGAT